MTSFTFQLIYSDRDENGKFKVTLITRSDDPLTNDLTRVKLFNGEGEAMFFMDYLRKHFKNDSVDVLEYFMDNKKKLCDILSEGQQIQHRLKRLDGTDSDWVGVIQGKHILFEGNIYKSLNAFMVAHYKAEHPTRKPGNGWKECEAFVNSHWVKLYVLRSIAS